MLRAGKIVLSPGATAVCAGAEVSFRVYVWEIGRRVRLVSVCECVCVQQNEGNLGAGLIGSGFVLGNEERERG